MRLSRHQPSAQLDRILRSSEIRVVNSAILIIAVLVSQSPAEAHRPGVLSTSRTTATHDAFLNPSGGGGTVQVTRLPVAAGPQAPAKAPSAPSKLTSTAISSNQIRLNWVDNSTNESGFKVERGNSSSGPWTQIATVGAGVVSYSDSGLEASTLYFYRVRAYNSVGDSSYSNIASSTTQAG